VKNAITIIGEINTMSLETNNNTLPFPAGHPQDYRKLIDEPEFCASKHLELGLPESVVSLSSLGYSQQEIQLCPSEFGISSAFKILSKEGLEIMRDLCLRMYDNRNANAGTGENRLGSYIRGAGYRSQFVKDFCDSPELAEHISKLAGTHLARHSVPAVACGINYAPEDITKGIDSWHTDSVAFDFVMLLSDPTKIKGGEFQYFAGTKQQGQELLGIEGEEGANAELPGEKVITVTFPAAGYGFLQQGNMIFHRACRLLEKAERMTMIPSFVVAPVTEDDATNSVNMANWGDPGIVPELTRHETWRASARLTELTAAIKLDDSNQDLLRELDKALEPLLSFRKELSQNQKSK